MRVVFYWLMLLALWEKGAENPLLAQSLFTPQQMQADAARLRQALEEAHPTRTLYITEAEWQALWEEAAQNWLVPLSEVDFFRSLAPIVAQLRDGHTNLWISEKLEEALENAPLFLPVKLKFIQGKAYLWRSYLPAALWPPGSQLIAINGRLIDEIIPLMQLYLSADGANQSHQYYQLENTRLFGLWYNLLFGRTDTYALEYLALGQEKPELVRVSGQTLAQMQANFERNYPSEAAPAPPLSWEWDKKSPLAFLTIRSFRPEAFEAFNIRFDDFISQCFSQLNKANTPHLVIDLRGNLGGNDAYGAQLLAHLLDTSFYYYESLELLKPACDFLSPTNLPVEVVPSRMLQENEKGTFNFINHPNLGPQLPASMAYLGQVWVLIDGGSFSTASEFAALCHHYHRATFVGQESGGAYYGGAGGFMPLLVLPHSGLRIQIPLLRHYLAVKNYPYSDRGLLPDVEIEGRPEDLQTGHDAVKEFVKKEVLKALEKP
ncbi:MAG: S41 family peptidase [Microscillaceae bacterium]